MNKNNRISEFSLILITQDNHTFLVVQADEVSIILDFFGKFNYQDDVPMQPIYAPPVTACLECGSRLVANHSCSIRNYGTQGLCIGEKFTLRCPGLLIIL